MSDYTVRNLKTIENMAERFGLGDGLEARFARGALELERFGLSYQRLAPGFRMPFGHRHAEQEEVYLVVGGSARIKVDDEIVELSAWDAIRVASSAIRALEGGPEGAEVLVIGAPQAQDTEMLQGWWE